MDGLTPFSTIRLSYHGSRFTYIHVRVSWIVLISSPHYSICNQLAVSHIYFNPIGRGRINFCQTSGQYCLFVEWKGEKYNFSAVGIHWLNFLFCFVCSYYCCYSIDLGSNTTLILLGFCNRYCSSLTVKLIYIFIKKGFPFVGDQIANNNGQS